MTFQSLWWKSLALQTMSSPQRLYICRAAASPSLMPGERCCPSLPSCVLALFVQVMSHAIPGPCPAVTPLCPHPRPWQIPHATCLLLAPTTWTSISKFSRKGGLHRTRSCRSRAPCGIVCPPVTLLPHTAGSGSRRVAPSEVPRRSKSHRVTAVKPTHPAFSWPGPLRAPPPTRSG